LAKQGKLKGCAPLKFDGVKISGSKGSFINGPLNESKEVISGFYLILAADLMKQLPLLKADPGFNDAAWNIEVRLILKAEGIN